MKLGILGTGMIVKALLTTIENLNIEYLSILGTDATKEETEMLVQQYGINDSYYQYEDMLKSDIDTVYVALPNHLHYEFSKKALLNNKNVIIEKPITSNYQELKELITIAEDKHLIMIEAMNIHYLPAYIELKNDIHSIGDLKIVNLNYSQYSSRYNQFKQGIILPAFDYKKSGGALMDINVYNLHFVIGLFGKPYSIEYKANIQNKIDTSGIIFLDYDSFKVVCIGAKDCKAPIQSTIQGNLGNIVINKPVNQFRKYEICNNEGEVSFKQFDETKHRLYYEFDEFIRIINQKDYCKAKQMLEVSSIVSEIMQQARYQEGIIFANDK